jgi:hypothetical protein
MRSVLLVWAMLGMALVGCGDRRLSVEQSAVPVTGIKVEQLYAVTPHVYRSGTPSRAALQQMQEQLGLRSVLFLHLNKNDSDEAAGLPFELYRIKMFEGHVDAVAVKQALTIIRNAPKPILIHSWAGSDRTALVIAVYRIAEQGWTVEDAIQELEQSDYGTQRAVFPGIQTWLRGDGVGRISP